MSQASRARLPRIGVMGEFSSGKSSLCNLLLGMQPLPERVVATRLPPVWMSYGHAQPYRVDLQGRGHPVDLDALDAVPLDQTQMIRIFLETDILEVCDLVDFPGISDPNLGSDLWIHLCDHLDGVLWCTHATQAWRHSEAMLWDSLPDTLRANSTLLVTRADKLRSEHDRRRVLRRLEVETAGRFDKILPLALPQALRAGSNHELWERSGADAFADHLIDLVTRLQINLYDQDTSDPGPSKMVALADLALEIARANLAADAAAARTGPDPRGRKHVLEGDDARPGPASPRTAEDFDPGSGPPERHRSGHPPRTS